MSQKNTLYDLLPNIYKLRDSEQGEPLKALLEILEAEAGKMEDNIRELYNNWFIETCDEWAVPYIGDLLGVRNLHEIQETAKFSRRAYVANTISYRRRKGTAPVLEQLAFDTTGWRARAVEFFQLLGTTQYFNHIRPGNKYTPDLRKTADLELLNSAFDTIAHTAEVRRISSGRGWYNIRNIGLFIWRIQSYSLQKSAAYTKSKAKGQYIINPLGLPAGLFNKPVTESNITHLAGEINVPALLRIRAIYDELEKRRQAIVTGEPHENVYFGENDTLEEKFNSVIKIYVDDEGLPVPAEEISICSLEGWKSPPSNKTYTRINPDGSIDIVNKPISLALDPEKGRIAFSDPSRVKSKVNVSYSYGFSADMGGGPYDRRESIEEFLADMAGRDNLMHIGVSKSITPVGSEPIVNSINKAIEKWNNKAGSITRGVICIMDNESYNETFKTIIIPENSHLMIIAASWPLSTIPGSSPELKERKAGYLEPRDLRPHLKGNFIIEGAGTGEISETGSLNMNGLLIEGHLKTGKGSLGMVNISHCTINPGRPAIVIDTNCDYLGGLALAKSIAGSIRIGTDVASLNFSGSIIDPGTASMAIQSGHSGLSIHHCTVLGEIDALSIEAGNSIFNERIIIERQQVGCIRYSYVTIDSKTPRRYKCQPEIIRQGGSIKAKDNIVPEYTSRTYGHYAYGQLSRHCSVLIRQGADDGSEMGAFYNLKQPQRETNLRTALDEYLRLGLEAGIIYVT